DHLGQLDKYDIPTIDLIVVDLYPFEETVAATEEEAQIIEQIDIGGIALIRAAAKNYGDVVIVPSRADYATLKDILDREKPVTEMEERRALARRAFAVSSHYDTAIFNYFNARGEEDYFKRSEMTARSLRYGENPHQKATFYGPLNEMFEQLSGKELSYNNLVDIDAAVQVMSELEEGDPSFAVLKHTNTCGLAVRPTVEAAWDAALAGDPVSAFGGILISNSEIDLATATKINQLFYEVLIAPSFAPDAHDLLTKKKKRVLLKYSHLRRPAQSFKSLLNGLVAQDTDLHQDSNDDLRSVTELEPTEEQKADLLFAATAAKHLKSNTIALVKNRQLIGMGCGQTSRVDACKQAIAKAHAFGFDTTGAVMASDAFFPFPDCVEIADNAGIKAVIQPGGSIKDQLSIDYCNENGIAMVFTGYRHFKH
ncbi:MAG: bifunctional phosphoribosylaminoimidazolecarboxamide formyltransferase/IMP cyclohydrolase, partial [Bacteroidota bacterium]